MKINAPILFIEINKYNYIFAAGNTYENFQFNLDFYKKIPLIGIRNNRFDDLNLILKTIKENVYLIEKKLDYIFKDVVIVIDNFNCSLINMSGFKKLNGSQLKKDYVIYIINSLKSKIIETEETKTILHIFNSSYLLDKKKISNLPIGLFGNFYSQELSFLLIDTNDQANLKKVFDKCNLKIKKIISKNFLLGIEVLNDKIDLETFLRIDLYDDNIDLIFFENSALRFNQTFNYGLNLIINDISKVTSLKNGTIKSILQNSNFLEENIKNDFIEEEFFNGQNFRKIKKKLFCEVAQARIEELAEIAIFENINVKNFLKKDLKIFLKINDQLNEKCFGNIYKNVFSSNNKFEIKFLKNYSNDEIFNNINSLVQYGWKKEAIPIVQEKKSIIARFFDLFFK